MECKIYITTEVFDKDGKLRCKRKRRSKSFVKAFLGILLAQVNPDTSSPGIPSTDGTDRNIDDHAINFDASGDIGGSPGILVGKGTTAVTANDYHIEDVIVHGTGSGQLSFSVNFFSALAVSDPNVSFTIHRDFTNSSGATITVNEEGIYIYGYTDAAETKSFLAIRDVEATGVDIGDGQCLRVTYTIKTST